MSSAAAALLIATASASSEQRAAVDRYLAFGPRGADWVLVEVESRKIERVTLPAQDVDGLAVSKDATWFAYVAPAGGNKGLWAWKRGDSVPRLLDSGPGRYSDPAIGPDGSIYFSHSPVTGRSHTFGTYAQVFRIGVDGNGMRQITDENGCHFGVSFTQRGQLQYIHSSCAAQAWVKRVTAVAQPDTLVAVAGSLAEATPSPDGRSVMFVTDEPDSFVVHQVSGKKPPRTLFALDRGMVRVRLAYGRNSNEIFYQQGGKVWVLDHGVRSVVATLEREVLQ